MPMTLNNYDGLLMACDDLGRNLPSEFEASTWWLEDPIDAAQIQRCIL